MSSSSCCVSLPGCSVARGDDTFLSQVFPYLCAYSNRNVQPLTRGSLQYGYLYFFAAILLFHIAGESMDDIMAVNWGTKFKASPRLLLVSLVIELWLLTLYSIAIAGLAVSLYSSGVVDSTMSAGVLFSFIGSVLSLVYVFSHWLLSRRFRLAGLRRPAKTKLDSVCSNLLRLLMLLWMVATAMDLIVASRKPTCLPTPASAGYWASGISCRMHRAISALSVLALISTCSIFCVNELSEKSFYASLTGYHKAALRDSVQIAPDPRKASSSISSSSSSSSFDKGQKLYHVYSLESNLVSHSSWVQRRDSLSSQQAVYPPTLLTHNSYSRSRSLGSMPVLDKDAEPTSVYSMPGSSSNPSITTCTLLTPSIYRQPSRIPSTYSSASATRRSPLSTMHRASQPEISIDLLSKTLDPHSPPWEKPAIRHVPLSEDPAIRKLAEGGGEPYNNDGDDDDDTQRLIGPTGNTMPKRRSIRRKLFPDISRHETPLIVVQTPTLSSRAASHSAIRRVPVPRTTSITSSGSLQSEESFNVRRPPAAARWSQQRGRRPWTYRNASAYSVGHRSYASMSSWYTDTIHE